VIQDKFLFAADAYRTRTTDFVGPLRTETPNVFLEAGSLSTSLGAAFTQALQDPAVAQLAGALAILDSPSQGGNANGSPVDELTRLFVAGTSNNGAAFIPFGTVTPNEITDPHAVMLAYRNFGKVNVSGMDLSFVYYPNPTWTFTGSYSYINKNLFKNLDGIGDISLNAPKNKFNLGATLKLHDPGLRLGGQLRYRGEFPMDSGVYRGTVDAATVFDLNLAYDLPINLSNGAITFVINGTNVLDKKHRGFVGAPEVGRLLSAGLTGRF
jgi:hypothetical protein